MKSDVIFMLEVPESFRRGLRLAVLLVLTLGMAAGCSRSTARLDQEEENHPLLQKAKVKYRAQDIEGAVKLYNLALEEQANLARAHLELGIIYDQNLEEYIRAIFHYQRYLELRPHTEKKSLINDAIRHARMSFAASLPDRPSEAVQEIADLKEEIKKLQLENEQLGALVRKADGGVLVTEIRSLGAASIVSAPAPAPAPAAKKVTPAGPTTYTVRRGDTLSRISLKMYGTKNRWKEILEANSNKLRDARSLRVGQELKIPR